MSRSVDDLSFDVWPPAIDVSTPANQQIFNPQFSVTNTSAAETVSLTHATLLVPVTTKGTNLAQSTDMVPSAITPGWTFGPGAAPPSDPGCVAFVLFPNDGVGDIPPRGSVAFTLTGVLVDTAAGTAVLQLQARTSAGPWAPNYEIVLTEPAMRPGISDYNVTETVLQGQVVVLNWATTGAAYCQIWDDQGYNLVDPSTGSTNLPTGGTLIDTPLQGSAPLQSNTALGRYYNRAYTLHALPAGSGNPDESQLTSTVQLPTIFNFSVTPPSLTPGGQATVTWSVANVDPTTGKIAVSLNPNDGTGPYPPIAIPPGQPNGSAVVTPTPQTTTTYTVAVDNGYGVPGFLPPTQDVPDPPPPPQTVTSPLTPGWQEMPGLAGLSVNLMIYVFPPFGIVAFANALWCWTSNPSALYRTSDGASWTAVATTPSLPPLDGLIVADLGDGEKLWAFGCVPLWSAGGPPFLASSSDGIHWDTQPTPAYPARCFGNYVAGDGMILVVGGVTAASNKYPLIFPITDVWSTSDGRTWTQVGNDFPGFSDLQMPSGAARFAGGLRTVSLDSNGALWGYSSSDGGKTWSRTTTAIAARFGNMSADLLPAGDVLLIYSSNFFGGTSGALVMDSTGAYSAAAALSPPTENGSNWSVATYDGWLWLAGVMGTIGSANSFNLQFFRLNQVLPGTTFTLTPSANNASEKRKRAPGTDSA